MSDKLQFVVRYSGRFSIGSDDKLKVLSDMRTAQQYDWAVLICIVECAGYLKLLKASDSSS